MTKGGLRFFDGLRMSGGKAQNDRVGRDRHVVPIASGLLAMTEGRLRFFDRLRMSGGGSQNGRGNKGGSKAVIVIAEFARYNSGVSSWSGRLRKSRIRGRVKCNLN